MKFENKERALALIEEIESLDKDLSIVICEIEALLNTQEITIHCKEGLVNVSRETYRKILKLILDSKNAKKLELMDKLSEL